MESDVGCFEIAVGQSKIETAWQFSEIERGREREGYNYY